MTQNRALFEAERKPVVQGDLCAGEVELHAHIERHTAQSRIIPGFVAKAMKHGDADAARAVPEAIVLMPKGKSTANGGSGETAGKEGIQLSRRQGTEQRRGRRSAWIINANVLAARLVCCGR